MTDETRKEQEKKDELTEKDLDKASGGHSTAAHDREMNRDKEAVVERR